MLNAQLSLSAAGPSGIAMGTGGLDITDETDMPQGLPEGGGEPSDV